MLTVLKFEVVKEKLWKFELKFHIIHMYMYIGGSKGTTPNGNPSENEHGMASYCLP